MLSFGSLRHRVERRTWLPQRRETRVRFICYFSFFIIFFVRAPDRLPNWGLIRVCLGHRNKKTTKLFSVSQGEHASFLGNGKGINQGEGWRVRSHTGLCCQTLRGQAASHPPGTDRPLWGRVSPDSQLQKPLPLLGKQSQKNICYP